MIFTHALFLRNWDLGTKDLDLHTGDDGPFRHVWTTAYSLYLLASVGDYDSDWYADSSGTRTLLVFFIFAINIVMFENRDQLNLHRFRTKRHQFLIILNVEKRIPKTSNNYFAPTLSNRRLNVLIAVVSDEYDTCMV